MQNYHRNILGIKEVFEEASSTASFGGSVLPGAFSGLQKRAGDPVWLGDITPEL